MKGFPGFPEGETDTTRIPNPFFSELLPIIDHLGELKITVYAFWALSRKEGRFRYLSLQEMTADKFLLDALSTPNLSGREALQEALERAVARGTLLKVAVAFEGGSEDFFFLNTPKGRAALEAINSGDWRPSSLPESPLELRMERPNVFTLYEQNIGPLTPMLAERLRDAEETYPPSWIEEAIRIAVENNVRKWRYIEAILEDWKTRGKDAREDRGDSEKARRRYIEGEYADFWDS